MLADETLIGDGEDGEAGFIKCRIALHFGFCFEFVMTGRKASEHFGNGVAVCWNEEVLHFLAILSEHAKHVAINWLIVARIEVKAPRLE